jgi:hypothetical protein
MKAEEEEGKWKNGWKRREKVRGDVKVWEALEMWTMEMGYSVKCKNYGDRKNGKTGATKYEFATSLN